MKGYFDQESKIVLEAHMKQQRHTCIYMKQNLANMNLCTTHSNVTRISDKKIKSLKQ